MTFPTLVSIFLVIFFSALVQGTTFLRIDGVVPDLVLIIFVLLSSFMRKWWIRFLILSFSILSIAFLVDWSLVLVYVGLAFVLSLFVLDYSPWYVFINILTAVFFGTICLNFLLIAGDWHLNIHNILIEVVYNVFVVGVLFLVLFIFFPRLYEKIN